MGKSRRRSREAALQTLYEIEVGKSQQTQAVANTLEAAELSDDLATYAQRIIEGVRTNQKQIDEIVSSAVQGYDYERLAAVDRNVLRVATYELYFEHGVPPAVSINEAIEIAKKYSTAESGRFVNGVLGRIMRESPKANWDPSLAPSEEESEDVTQEAEPEPEVETLEADSEEAQRLAKVGGWKIRKEDS
jgi:transcription antitermination protein NusB